MWDRPASPEKKVSVLSKADCITCAGRRQRLFYYGFLLQAGRFPGLEHFIRYIPVSLSPDLPPRKVDISQLHKTDTPLFVSGGGWFPWQNQARTIFAVAKTIERKNRGRIQIYGTPHERTGSSPEERLILDVYDRIEELSRRSQRIQVMGYVGREELLKVYSNADVAVEAMGYNLERELAFTTRTIEYLWCGLPVIYNDFGEIADHIRDYNAGWTVNPDDDCSIQDAIDEIFSNPALLEQKSKNAQRLVKDRFAWDKTILPLVDFLRNPVSQAVTDPVMGVIYTRPSFLQAQGDPIDVPLKADGMFVSQRFIIPAENISAIEVPYTLANSEAKNKIETVEILIRGKNGKVLCRNKIKGDNLSPSGSLLLRLPALRGPAGGDELVFSVKVNKKTTIPADERLLLTRGFSTVHYPLVADKDFPIMGIVEGRNVPVLSLALSFMPAEYSTVYKFKMLSARALYLLKRGEYKRVIRAVKRRMPQLVKQLRTE